MRARSRLKYFCMFVRRYVSEASQELLHKLHHFGVHFSMAESISKRFRV
jgi:hypothetical protein